MKRIIITSASVAAMAVAAPLAAQTTVDADQEGAGNSATIDQVDNDTNSIVLDQLGTNSNVEIFQVGTEQSMTITQGPDGDANGMFAVQGDVGGAGANTLDATQSGSTNFAAFGQNSATNNIFAIQSGDTNEMFVDQGFAGGAGEEGSGNTATLTQGGDGNLVNVVQNAATTGGGNEVVVDQVSDGNFADIAQEGASNFAFAGQGDVGGAGSNSLEASQSGDGNFLAIGQNSFGNVANSTQTGNGNEVLIDQGFVDGTGAGGDGNEANALQVGDGNSIIINQNVLNAGGGNAATVNQYGNNWDIQIDQEGTGQTMTITQGTPPTP